MRITTLDQIKNPEWLRDARNYLAQHIAIHNLKGSQIHDHIIALYRDLKEPITYQGKEVWLETEVLEVSDIDDWLERFCSPVPDKIRPYLTCGTRKRGIIITSIIRAHDALGTKGWGKRV